MSFIGSLGIYIFLGVCVFVSCMILYFAKKLNKEVSGTELGKFNH